jgi:calcineurin-like phosphoesterase
VSLKQSGADSVAVGNEVFLHMDATKILSNERVNKKVVRKGRSK